MRTPTPPDHFRSLLLVQPADIGDLVATTPAIAALRVAHPDSHITLLTTAHAAPVIPPGLVDAVITLDRAGFNGTRAFFRPANLRRLLGLGRYDAVIFFRHLTLRAGTLKFALIALAARAPRRFGLDNGNGWFLTDRLADAGFGTRPEAQYWLDLAALAGADSTPRPAAIHIGPAPDLPAATGPRIVIHAGSGGYAPARRWDPAGFAAVADALAREDGAQIVLVGAAGDDAAAVRAAMTTTPVDLSGQTDLAALAGLLTNADLFIGADSGVMHIAAAVGVPVVALFGPSNADAWGPWSPGRPAVVLRSVALCSPCSYVGHGVGLREGCPARTCMRMITPARVIVTARALLRCEEPPPRIAEPPLAPDICRVPILGAPVAALTYPDWLNLIGGWVARGERHQVCTVNPEFLMIARRDSNFRNILNRASLCVPDGVGLLLAARILGDRLPARITGSDGLPLIAEAAARAGWRLYLLGAAPGVAEEAAAILTARYPGLQIAGTASGSPAPDEEDALVEAVNASGAHLLFVAYGAPEQDKWIARNLPRLKVCMAMGVGGAFDFVAGRVPRAPLWMRRAGLEWLYRLYRQPWRWRRMLRLPLFLLAVLARRLRPHRKT